MLVEVTLERVWPPHPEVQSQIFRLVFWGFDIIRNQKDERKRVRKSERIGRNVKEYERIKRG